jgi:hypothetical protein
MLVPCDDLHVAERLQQRRVLFRVRAHRDGRSQDAMARADIDCE